MKIAFDWDGTTWGSNGHQLLQQMALDLKKAGWEVFILSQVPEGAIEQRKAEIKAIVPDMEVLVVANWGDKPLVMKENGIEWLVDDTDAVCQMVIEKGLHILQVK